MEPKYDLEGNQIKAGTFTVFHNGVLVLNNVEILGTTEFRGLPKLGRDKISSYMPGKSIKEISIFRITVTRFSFRKYLVKKFIKRPKLCLILRP